MGAIRPPSKPFKGLSLIKKILVANRGEIAVRIVRACAEMNITSAAIYSDADRNALHVKKADEAYNIGPDPVGGYLNAHRIVNLAVTAGCDATRFIPATDSCPKIRNSPRSARAAGLSSSARRPRRSGAWATRSRRAGP